MVDTFGNHYLALCRTLMVAYIIKRNRKVLQETMLEPKCEEVDCDFDIVENHVPECVSSLNVAYDLKKKYEHSFEIPQTMLEPKLEKQEPDFDSVENDILENCIGSLNGSYDFKEKNEDLFEITPTMLEPKLEEHDPEFDTEKYIPPDAEINENQSTHSMLEGVTEVLITKTDNSEASDESYGEELGDNVSGRSEFDLNTEAIKIEVEEDNTETFDVQYKCNCCHKLYYYRSQFKKHIPKCLNPTKQAVITATIIRKLVCRCPICFKTLMSQKQVNQHIQNMHNKGAKQYPCDCCNYIGISKTKLKYHKIKEHEEKKYFCDICSKGFFRQGFLNKHKKYHTKDVVKSICPVCGKKFHHTNLYYHMKIHNRIHNYKCNHCEKTFYSMGHLKRHELTHTKIRSYQCKMCSKMYYSTSELKQHTYIHQDKKPHHCKFCNKGFVSKYSYRLHLLTYPGDFKCPFCYKRFINENILSFHKKRSHKNEMQDEEEN